MNTDLVRRLVEERFPQWSGLPITPVAEQGNDNRTFRVGDRLSVRLPSHQSYVAGISKEDEFLPLLAEHLSVPVPAPVAAGRPGVEYPHPWSVRHWLPGNAPDRDPELDRARFARDIWLFLRELHMVPAHVGPPAGAHSFYRGCHPRVYGDQVQEALSGLGDQVDVATCAAICHDALQSAWETTAVWFHGDVAVGNLLTVNGKLAAVIDFGTCGVGDPACDLVIAWTFFGRQERQIFREAVELPDDVWSRARGWAVWKALITLSDRSNPQYETQARALRELVVDTVGGGE